MIGEHNITCSHWCFTKEAVIGKVFWVNKLVISQVHLCDISVNNTNPCLCLEIVQYYKDIILYPRI